GWLPRLPPRRNAPPAARRSRTASAGCAPRSPPTAAPPRAAGARRGGGSWFRGGRDRGSASDGSHREVSVMRTVYTGPGSRTGGAWSLPRRLSLAERPPSEWRLVSLGGADGEHRQ